MTAALLAPEKPIVPSFGTARLLPVTFLNLGLESDTDVIGTVNRLSGLRHGRMVEIRFPSGDYESATWVLASSPRFETVLGEWAALPVGIAEAVGDVPVFAPIWHGLRVTGSELGLVAVREVASPLPHAFMHDLWLLERIAQKLGLLPLPAGNLWREPIPASLPTSSWITRTG